MTGEVAVTLKLVSMSVLGKAPWGLSWPLLIGAVLFAMLLAQPALLNDPDIYWHVRVGQWILQELEIPRVDIFTHTMEGARWTAHEWLAEVLLALAFNIGGWTGTVILSAAAVSGALALLARYILRYLQPIYAILLVVLAGSLLAPHLLARPHVLILPILATWGIVLMSARDEDRVPALGFALLMVVWANLHGSFVFGLALIGPFALDAVLMSGRGRRGAVARRWGIFFIASIGASMVTPWGPKALLFAFEVDRMSFSLSQIGEWRSPNFQKFQPLELCLLLGAGAALSRGLRLPWLRIFLLLGLLHLALQHARHADLLGLLAPVLLAKPLAEQWFAKSAHQGAATPLDRAFRLFAPRASAATTVLVLAVLAGVSFQVIRSDTLRPAAAVTPQAAVQALSESGATGPGLNGYDFGGYLIYIGRRTFVDGRADLFGDRFLRAYYGAVMLEEPGALPALLEGHGIQWTLLPPGVPAIALLDHMPGWRRFYADRIAVVHIRKP
jgi:hypothetical protein